MISEGLLICLVGRGSIGACHLRNLNSLGQKNIIAYSENSNKEKKTKIDTIEREIFFNNPRRIFKLGFRIFIFWY